MASTSYKTRVIVKEHTDKQADFAGTYNLLVAAKSVPSPASPPNTVESTTMEDDQQTFEKGIKTSDSREITGNLEKNIFQRWMDMEIKNLILFICMERTVSAALQNMHM